MMIANTLKPPIGFQDKTNQWVWILDRGKIVDRDDDNKPTRMTGTLKDISHIKKAEERLKLFCQMYREYFGRGRHL